MHHLDEFATVETLDSNSILVQQRLDSHLLQLNLPTGLNPLNSYLHHCFQEVAAVVRFTSALAIHIPQQESLQQQVYL